ncbi:MAG: 50S ribosomal protein L18 [Flavobacteriaceae bacterium]|jgi:large subunit ribosomal protein L18|nr:50S ribosomal protein L18 [Flavobacteriaceae bacterium]
MGLTKSARRNRIHLRIRKTIQGTSEKPRLSIYRSNKEIYAQVIDDVNGKTLAAASSRDKEIADAKAENKMSEAQLVGKLVGERAKKAGVSTIGFDRSGYLYHGRVKSLADGAREAGLNF